MIPEFIPWVEIIRFVLLIAAAWFSFLIWRWSQIDSRRAREELIRNRYVTSDIIFRIPEGATANDSHYRFSLFKVRVEEESGWVNFLRKILRADFRGTTTLSASGVYDKGRDYMRSRASTPSVPNMSAPPRQSEPQLPDNISQITEMEAYSELGLDDDDFAVSETKFSIDLHTADPAEVDRRIGVIFDLIDEAYSGSS